MMTPDADPNVAEVAWRLKQMETTVGKLESRMAEGFGHLTAQMSQLGFVPRNEYAIEQRSTLQQIDHVRVIAEGAKTLAMWSLGLVGSTAIGAIVTGLLIKAAG